MRVKGDAQVELVPSKVQWKLASSLAVKAIEMEFEGVKTSEGVTSPKVTAGGVVSMFHECCAGALEFPTASFAMTLKV